jgi:hypothetical protein
VRTIFVKQIPDATHLNARRYSIESGLTLSQIITAALDAFLVDRLPRVQAHEPSSPNEVQDALDRIASEVQS